MNENSEIKIYLEKIEDTNIKLQIITDKKLIKKLALLFTRDVKNIL